MLISLYKNSFYLSLLVLGKFKKVRGMPDLNLMAKKYSAHT